MAIFVLIALQNIQNCFMKVILDIKDNKALHLLEVLKSLPYVKITLEEDIPEEHKAIVRDRILNTNPNDMVAWSEALQKLTIKG